MCGICGMFELDPGRRAQEERVSRMNDALAHRGPNDAGLWNGGHVVLAMRRLSVIDLFRGHQPMLSEDGRLALVFNGEIYNYRELRADLEARGAVFRTTSDTEVILHAYDAWGDAALDRFNGMFAIALYDGRRDRLLLARDRLGIKPLVYAQRDGALVFASELDALYRSGMVRGRVDAAALDAYFAYLYVPAPDTIFEDARKLMPGEKLVIERGRVRVERYWRVQMEPNPAWTLPEAADRYRELLNDAVRMQRVSDVPLGAFLSGGIDSCSVVGALAQMSAAPVKTFTIGFDDAQVDELQFARAAARHFGTDHCETILSPDTAAVAAELIRYFGEPFADSSAIPTWLVSGIARDHVTVALSGDGGDELFAGYTWVHMACRVARYRRAPGVLRRLAAALLSRLPATPWLAKVRRFSADSFLSPDEALRRRETCFDAGAREGLLRTEWRERAAARSVDRFLEHTEAAAGLSPPDRMLHQDLSMYLPDDILTKVDRMSMAHGLEARVPLLDHRLVEFAATVPFDLKYRRGVSKRLVKHALRRMLPLELLVQRKQGFAVPIHRWFREELRGHFEELALAPDARNRSWLEHDAVRALLRAHLEGRDHYGHHLWAVLMFEHWLRYIETVPGLSLS